MIVYIKESKYSSVEVDAEAFEEACVKVADAWRDGQIILDHVNSAMFFDVGEDEDMYYEEAYFPASRGEFAGKVE